MSNSPITVVASRDGKLSRHFLRLNIRLSQNSFEDDFPFDTQNGFYRQFKKVKSPYRIVNSETVSFGGAPLFKSGSSGLVMKKPKEKIEIEGVKQYFLVKRTTARGGYFLYQTIKKVSPEELQGGNFLLGLPDTDDFTYTVQAHLQVRRNGIRRGLTWGPHVYALQKKGSVVEFHRRVPESNPAQWVFEKKIILPKF